MRHALLFVQQLDTRQAATSTNKESRESHTKPWGHGPRCSMERARRVHRRQPQPRQEAHIDPCCGRKHHTPTHTSTVEEREGACFPPATGVPWKHR